MFTSVKYKKRDESINLQFTIVKFEMKLLKF